MNVIGRFAGHVARAGAGAADEAVKFKASIAGPPVASFIEPRGVMPDAELFAPFMQLLGDFAPVRAAAIVHRAGNKFDVLPLKLTLEQGSAAALDAASYGKGSGYLNGAEISSSALDDTRLAALAYQTPDGNVRALWFSARRFSEPKPDEPVLRGALYTAFPKLY